MKWLYFENTDGGMEVHAFFGIHGPQVLYGWMRPDCMVEDQALQNWMLGSRIGDYYEHRLGVIVRVNT